MFSVHTVRDFRVSGKDGSGISQVYTIALGKGVDMRPILNLTAGGKAAALTAILLLCLLPAAAGCFAPPSAGGPPPLPGGPEYSALMVSSDLAAGDNRVVFGLVDRDNRPVAADTAQVRAVYTAPGAARGMERATAKAQFLPWPPAGSGRGVFVANLTFDRAGAATPDDPGLWELEITAADNDGQTIQAKTAVRVTAEPVTPAIGAPAPRSITPTAGPNVALATISSAAEPDPELYQLSVHQALDAGLPLVVLFSTPAFCVSATCGPQLEILSALKERYRGRANFIHIEVFADPHLIQGNRLTAKRVPAVTEWGLPTEPWTFVVDKEGRIAAKFEQFTPAETLAAALESVL